ncbi:MAG: DUF1611 domain-containing protein [Gammaproteobacteria bacterium]|nr:MAG: DUF1611 domain-containing protein [Gammaproteobacteria bacterium]
MTEATDIAVRLARAKWAYVTRNVDHDLASQLLAGDHAPNAGDLLLARVDQRGQHRRLELTTSRRAELFEGDEIVVAYADRYAPDQFEGMVPDHLGRCRLVAAGGIAARLLHAHQRVKSATRITPLGLLADSEGARLNLHRFRLPTQQEIAPEPLFLAVAGTAMNSGKTTVCSNLVKGLVRRKLRVAAAKLTGTGAGADYRSLIDAGAEPVFDFVDAGYASTYRLDHATVWKVARTLCAHLTASRPDVVVLEIADGLLQEETAALLARKSFNRRLDGVMFAAYDALGAQAGVAWLEQQKIPVIGVTGVLTNSPLMVREAQHATQLPVYATEALRRTNVAALVHNCLQARRHRRDS